MKKIFKLEDNTFASLKTIKSSKNLVNAYKFRVSSKNLDKSRISSKVAKESSTLTEKVDNSDFEISTPPIIMASGKVEKSLEKNIQVLQDSFVEDLILKSIKVCGREGKIAFIQGLIDINFVAEYIVEPLERINGKSVTEKIILESISVPQVESESDLGKLAGQLCKGKAVVFVDGIKSGIVCSVDSFKVRTPEEPPNSAVLYGPRAGFTEDIKTNINQIRKILSTPHCIRKALKVGRITQTDVSIMYLDNVADPRVVRRIEKALLDIDIDGVVDSHYLTQYLSSRKYSIFKQVGIAEKPDIIAAKMLEGRVAILVDGSPIVLTLPFMLIEDLQSSNDYYSNRHRAVFLRVLRLLSIVVTVYLPAMYVAVQIYHYKAIPLKFLITIINATQGLPFTPFAEMIFTLILFEILYEASLRMPSYLGLAMSIVGALILGDMAVAAGLISPPAVMIMALSGITLYTIPYQVQQFSLLRLLCVGIGGTLGFYGIVLFTIYIVMYLCDFDSLGTPYLAPISPMYHNDMKDGVLKYDISKMITRPRAIPTINSKRQTTNRRQK